MKSPPGRPNRLWAHSALVTAQAMLLLGIEGCGGPSLQPWHMAALTEEFTADRADSQARSFDDYVALEQKLFKQLDKQVYAKTATGPAHALERYSSGSAADPRRRQPNWNRSFELIGEKAVGGVLLLHGMSDSPYSLRALGEALDRRSYWVIGLRLPGHGTAPSGLKHVTWQDMAAAVRLSMAHLGSKLGSKPIHIVGYSTGASLALDFTLNALEQEGREPMPASLVLISPAIRVHPTGALAGLKNAMAAVPGLGRLAYLSIVDEFDPYKYNSFATKAGAEVHHITRNADRRIRTIAKDSAAIAKLPLNPSSGGAG